MLFKGYDHDAIAQYNRYLQSGDFDIQLLTFSLYRFRFRKYSSWETVFFLVFGRSLMTVYICDCRWFNSKAILYDSLTIPIHKKKSNSRML